eukprot:CAMPEP_0172568812 /NCGR_PEP_ID=MMETSP1067-20121228/121195_1 /TAXON_ID=265564 ORGANISM="Thalassiosira punctigera, Strain Tpunct2005C2" /NCGR_SAMPLE_ID=MMETSP1067 /ASSEMBLY_ACC=CAM_ASM_000444 /LENGTH=158 /DNA_ID=CAMNT_0013360505 /DNA_START=110 /DNA_END=583 /DNA_ORIENTATION=+
MPDSQCIRTPVYCILYASEVREERTDRDKRIWERDDGRKEWNGNDRLRSRKLRLNAEVRGASVGVSCIVLHRWICKSILLVYSAPPAGSRLESYSYAHHRPAAHLASKRQCLRIIAALVLFETPSTQLGSLRKWDRSMRSPVGSTLTACSAANSPNDD